MVFSVLSEVDLRRIPSGFAGPSSLIPIATVKLEVKSIFWYGRYVQSLEKGDTGRLELVGTGGERIMENTTISNPMVEIGRLD